MGSDGELSEAVSESIEALILRNTACFLAAVETMDERVAEHLIRYCVMHPVYHEPTDLLPLIEKELKRKGYPHFNKLFSEAKETVE